MTTICTPTSSSGLNSSVTTPEKPTPNVLEEVYKIPVITSQNKNPVVSAPNQSNKVFMWRKDSKMHDQIIAPKIVPSQNSNDGQLAIKKTPQTLPLNSPGSTNPGNENQISSPGKSLKQLVSHSIDIAVFQMSPRQVKVKFAFLTVGDVDTKSQRFVTEVLIQAKWVEPKLRGLTDASQVEKIEELWDPKLKIQNLEEIKGGRDEKWHTIKLGEVDPVVVYRRRLKGSFYENMELKDFPRDVQDISVILRSELPTSEIDLVPDPDELSTVEVSTFQDKQEWSMYKHVDVSTKLPETDDDDNLDENPFLNIPIITATARVARRSTFFFWNAILIMMCIVTLSFCGFALDYQDVKFRIAGNLTLLLTSVAFKLSVNQHLPMIPYLTGLDIYLLSSMMFLCFMTLLFAFLAVLKDDPQRAKRADTICLSTLVPFQLLFHILFGIAFFKKTNKRRKEMQQKDLEYLKEKDSKDRVRKETKIGLPDANGSLVVNNNNNNNNKAKGDSLA
ncbi:gamma-aminobutyric acid receptor subunit beta-1-like isoform X4 [Symsagittifera roscoffensis]|uniref:gamma-aminobutyric acid receptor subunit beta-1-like isoform X4 n=1 Tax=Symsagittifera roscoffensis TaxID=84072 RepID=UPI00307C6D0D